MPVEIEVGAVVDSLELLPAERELVLDVERLLGVVRQLVRCVLVEPQLLGADAEAPVPLHTRLLPLVEPALVLVRPHEELHLHLLELARAEDEVPRSDLVAERLAHLRDPERDLLAGRLHDVEIVDVNPLRSLRPQVYDGGVLLHRPHERLEHEVEHAGLGEVALVRLTGVLAGLLRALKLIQLVRAEARLARAAVDQGIGETLDMPRGFPHSGVHQDRGVQSLDVTALVHHRAPPAFLEVLLQLDTERSVVPHRAEPAVDLGRLEDEAPALGQGH